MWTWGEGSGALLGDKMQESHLWASCRWNEGKPPGTLLLGSGCRVPAVIARELSGIGMNLLLSSCGMVWAEEKSNQNWQEGFKSGWYVSLGTHVSAAQCQMCPPSTARAQAHARDMGVSGGRGAMHPCLCLCNEPGFGNYEIWYFSFFQNRNSEVARAASTRGKARQRPLDQSELVFGCLELGGNAGSSFTLR